MDNFVNINILNVLFLVLIFLLGGVNKIINFENTTKFLEDKVNSIHLDFIFYASVFLVILFFYFNIYNNNNNTLTEDNKNYLFGLISFSLCFILFLAYFNNKQFKYIHLFYNCVIIGVITLLISSSLIILYSLFSGKYKSYAYVATTGLAVFTAMTILIFHFPTNKSEVISFTKNLSIVGGLMVLSNQFM
jgi:hypothetical protein